MKKNLLVSGAILLIAAAIWWWRRPTEAKEAEEAKPVAAVQVLPVVSESIGRTLTAYGTVESSPDGAVTVTLAYDCVVRSVAAAVGSRVSREEVLLRVEPTPSARLELDSARGVATQAIGSLAAVRQRFDLRLATDDDLRTAEQAAQDARLRLASLEGRGVGDPGGQLAAPVAGIVVKLDAQIGAVVPAGSAIATIASSDHLQVRLGMEPSDAAAVKAGQPVMLTAVNRPDAMAIKSVVGETGAAADAGTGSLEIRAPLPEASGWFPGERVQAEIEVERRIALVVPRSAVLPEDDQEVLYTVVGGKAVKHTVQVGISSGEKVEVSGGDLKAGDSVVVQGNYELAEGMDVQLGDNGRKADDDGQAEAKP